MINYFLFFYFFFSFNAEAMCTRNSFKVLLWNSHSNASLVRVDEMSPEGGGAIRYIVIDFNKVKMNQFLVSSDFSPGGTETPQRVTYKDCKNVIDGLFKKLKELDFSVDANKFNSLECSNDRSRLIDLIPIEKKFRENNEVYENKSNVIIIKDNSSCNASCVYGKANLSSSLRTCD